MRDSRRMVRALGRVLNREIGGMAAGKWPAFVRPGVLPKIELGDRRYAVRNYPVV